MARVIYDEGLAKRKQLISIINRLRNGTVQPRDVFIELCMILYWIVDRWCREHDTTAR